jgi:UDP-N-acetylglucosamine 2-epimerase
MKIISVVGARPEFVQAALLSKAIRKQHVEILVHTGQHYDYMMNDVFFRDLELSAPEQNLGVGSGSHAQQTGEIMIRFEQVLQRERPDWVIVRGDTNSTLGAALAAAKLGFPVAHIEAGMRSFNRAMPEEINRVLADRLSALLFCATETSVQNLAQEGIVAGVHYVGDVMFDAALHFSALAVAQSHVLEQARLIPGKYLLVTVHRSANTDNRENLRRIFSALDQLDEPIVFPVHPRTRGVLNELQIEPRPHVRLIEPVGYLDMLNLEKHARKILTDSGGVQREAYYLGVPCITLRDETEWVETIEDGWNVLVGADADRIVNAVHAFEPPTGKPSGRFGDGRASEKIVEILNVEAKR